MLHGLIHQTRVWIVRSGFDKSNPYNLLTCLLMPTDPLNGLLLLSGFLLGQ